MSSRGGGGAAGAAAAKPRSVLQSKETIGLLFQYDVVSDAERDRLLQLHEQRAEQKVRELAAAAATTSPAKRAATAGAAEIPASPADAPYRKRTEQSGTVALQFNEALPEVVSAGAASAATENFLELVTSYEVGAYRFMNEAPATRAEALLDRMRTMGRLICGKNKTGRPTRVGAVSQDKMWHTGRVCCDTEGKLNTSSVILEGELGDRVPVDLSLVANYQLFPGQIIAACGTNPDGRAFRATAIFSDAPARPVTTSVADLSAYYGEAIAVAVAAGPYCPSSSLDFTPLVELVDAIIAKPVDVLVLLGPFVDIGNAQVKACDIDVTFEQIYSERVGPVLARLPAAVQLVLVPSVQDACHAFTVPQPAFSKQLFGLQSANNVHVVDNPSEFSVNGTLFGVTSLDTVMHLSQGEIALSQSSDKLRRACQALLEQRSFYPLFPPHADVPIDAARSDNLKMQRTPDVLIVPSLMRYFVKDVSVACSVLGRSVAHTALCVNPGRLVVGNSSGTYARLSIAPLKAPVPGADVGGTGGDGAGGASTSSDAASELEHEISKRTRVDVVNL